MLCIRGVSKSAFKKLSAISRQLSARNLGYGRLLVDAHSPTRRSVAGTLRSQALLLASCNRNGITHKRLTFRLTRGGHLPVLPVT